jgi:uncharacterized protein YkwD
MGHDSSDGTGSTKRIEKYGQWQSTAGENCSYGSADAMGVVL